MKNSEIIEGFKAVEFMRRERDQISREIQGMNFEELQKYFEQRRMQLKVQSTTNEKAALLQIG